MQRIPRNRRGFTIIEVIMVIVLMGIFSYGISIYVVRVIDSWKFLTQRYEMEQDGKLALDFIVRGCKEIGIDSFSSPAISSGSSTDITFTDTDSATVSYSYSYSGETVYKNSQPLVKNAAFFEIKYYGSSNSEIDPGTGSLTTAQINDIWYLYVRFVLTKGDQAAVYSSYIFPKNFLAR